MDERQARERSRLLHEDQLDFYRNGIESAEWIPLWSIRHAGDEAVVHFSALVPNSQVETSLSYASWDFYMDDCNPGFDVDDDTGAIEYYRFAPPRECEPFVVPRDFHGIHQNAVEIAEEFRLFHNLYHDGAGSYYAMDRSGAEEAVVRTQEDLVECRRVYLLKYCGARTAHAGIYFQNIRYSVCTPAELELEDHREDIADGLLRCDIAAGGDHLADGQNSSGILYGKRLLKGLDPGQPGDWVPPDERAYESFVIGRDAGGRELSHSCNPSLLADFFGGNPDAPHYFTPVYFKRAVLRRYLDEPEKYSVGPSGLACGRIWSIRLDGDQADHVVAPLGDLGRDLPHVEQKHFRLHNVVPEGGFSPAFLDRNFRNRPTRPQQPDSLFKDQFEYVQSAWRERFGWDLLRPLAAEDAHAYLSLHRLTIDSQKEFDEQVGALQKVVIESINEPEMIARIKSPPKDLKGKGSIGKLEVLLAENDSSGEFAKPIRALRGLQDLRGGTAHRKDTSEFERGQETFGIQSMNRVLGFDQVLRGVASFVFYLEENILDNSGIDLS